MMTTVYYNGNKYEKMRSVIYVLQGAFDGPGYKRKRYPPGKNVRGFRAIYDPPKAT